MNIRFATILAALTIACMPAFAQESKPAPEAPAAKPVEKPAVEPVKKDDKKPDPAPAEKKTTTPDKKPQEDKLVYCQLKTTKGDITLELNETKAPISVANFMKYVEKGHYNGTVFHRVINGFMIQGGGFDKDMNQKAVDKPISNEWKNGLKNTVYTIAMARTGDPNSATAQFYINVKDNPNLDEPISGGAGYAVFGKVIAGMATVDAIKAVPTGQHKNGMPNVPTEPVVINEAKKLTAEEAKAAVGK